MDANEKFTFAEFRSVAAWAFRAAWKIDGPAMVVCALIALGGSVLPALLMSQSSRIMDALVAQIGTNPGIAGLLGPLVMVVLCLFGASLYYLLPDLMSQYMQVRFDKGSYHMMIDALKDIPIRWFDDPEFATDMERYQSSTNITWLALGTVNLIGYLGAVVSLLVLAATVSWPIFILILVLAAAYMVLAVRLSMREFQHWMDEGESKKRQAWYRNVLTSTWNAKDLRVLSAGPGFLRLWRTEAHGALERRRVFDEESSKKWDKLRILGYVSQLGILSSALGFLCWGYVSLGQLLLFVSLAFALPDTLMSLGNGLVRPLFLLRTNRYFKRFFDRDWHSGIPGPAIGEAVAPDLASGLVARTASSGTSDTSAAGADSDGAAPRELIFDIQGIGYEYKPGHHALRDVSFQIHQGEIIALVGHNGAGKSTLTKILLGFYHPTAGRVLYRGKPYTKELIASLTHQIGATFQDFHRFEMSLRENVAFGNITFLSDDPVLVQALEKGGGGPLLQKAQGDLGRYVGRWYTDDGLELSGGEWQRLTTSRAYVNDRSVFVMDEPASMLDPVAEIKQFEALRDDLGRRTAILVSHRIGFARLADRIAVMDQGRLVELGSHDELMALGGHYAGLFAAQAEWYDHDVLPDAARRPGTSAKTTKTAVQESAQGAAP